MKKTADEWLTQLLDLLAKYRKSHTEMEHTVVYDSYRPFFTCCVIGYPYRCDLCKAYDRMMNKEEK